MNYVFGILGPVSMLAACVFEFLARRVARKPRHNAALPVKFRRFADIGLVAAWLLLGGAYLLTDASAGDARFEAWMTWMLLALLILDILYLYLRRGRPRSEGKKKHFWEI